MPDTYLTLGGYTFDGFGVPEKINGGGAHRLAIHKMLGGQRVIDALGADDDDIKFTGRFRGAGAMDDAAFMDAMRRAGTQVTLSYWNQSVQVVVAKFTFSFERFYEVPYQLECVVVSNGATAPPTSTPTTDQTVRSDVAAAQTTASSSAPVAAQVGYVGGAYASVSPLPDIANGIGAVVGAVAGAANAVIGTVQSAIGVVQGAVNDATSALGALASAADIQVGLPGGIVVGLDPSVMAAQLTAQAQAMVDGAAAQVTLPFLQRIGINLSAQVRL